MNEKIIRYLFYVAIVVSICILFSCQREQYGRFEQVKQQLTEIKSNQYKLDREIRATADTNKQLKSDIERSRKQVDKIADANNSIRSDLEEAGRIIDNSQQIVRRIQERTKKEGK